MERVMEKVMEFQCSKKYEPCAGFSLHACSNGEEFN